MKACATILPGVLLLAACRASEPGPSASGYLGIDQVTILTKGME